MSRTHTRIQLTVEIVGSTYGPDWKIADIIKQAEEESVPDLINRLRSNERTADIRVVGTPVVQVITVFSK